MGTRILSIKPEIAENVLSVAARNPLSASGKTER
jgi:hypothetical protein